MKADSPIALTVDQTAHLADCGRSRVYRAIKAQTLVSFKRGYRRLIPTVAANAWIKRGKLA
jgi:hypothetical protein